jgi:hypothetical protein
MDQYQVFACERCGGNRVYGNCEFVSARRPLLKCEGRCRQLTFHRFVEVDNGLVGSAGRSRPSTRRDEMRIQ